MCKLWRRKRSRPVALGVESAAGTWVGQRDNNEDSYAAADELGLYLVADGMGGYEGGEVASRAAVSSIESLYRRVGGDVDATWPFKRDRRLTYEESLLTVGIRQANQAIEARKTPQLSMMGSTVVALVLRGARAIVGHVGDSRLYLLRGGALTQVTKDHSLLEEFRRSTGRDVDAESFAWSNVVTRALGSDKALPDVVSLECQLGDRFLLCSDGLTEKLDDAHIARALSIGELEGARDLLLLEAEEAGTRDNTTVVLCDLVEAQG